jgi:hypothetical protein
VLVASGTSNITREVLEGDHNVSIMHTNGTVNTTLYVRTGESTEYSAQIATDPTIPHISMVVGDAGDVRVMSVIEEDTISDDSPNYWSAVTPAKKTFNSTIASSGGTATISVEVPVVERMPTDVVDQNERGWRPNSTTVDDNVRYWYHNAYNASEWQGPFDASGNISDGVLSIGVDTGDVDQIVVEFNGRALGDFGNDGEVSVLDGVQILRYRAFLENFAANDRFYGDVSNDGEVSVLDAVKVLRYRAFLEDKYYQPI